LKTQFINILTDADMTEDGYSLAVNVEQISGYSIQSVWTTDGIPSGKLFLQISDENPFVGDPTIWTVIPISIVDITASLGYPTNNLVYKDSLAGYRWLRVGYAFNSGSGVLNVNFSAKGVSP